MINLLEIIQFMKTIDVGIMDIDVKTRISEQGYEVLNREIKDT
jgi:hypothetical protein